MMAFKCHHLIIKAKMEKSIYTYLFERAGKFYLYNSETNLFACINSDLYEALYNSEYEKIPPDILNSLIGSKIIKDESQRYDYYHASRIHHFTSINTPESMSLVIAPTVGCNFACPYCFEGEKDNITMNDKVIDDLILFINRDKKLKKLYITWYGGEPLTVFGKMKTITGRILQECTAKLVSQSIVTNGYLLTNDVITFMKENRFKSIQITLDGTEEHHNKTRFLKGNHEPTFKRIIENLDRLVANRPKEMRINIRVNINKKNQDDFAEISKTIKERYNSSHIHVYPGFIREVSKDGKRLNYQSFCYIEKYEFHLKQIKKGMNHSLYPKHQKKGCMVCRNNSFVVGPSGELYKCWNDFNHPEKIIGHIEDNKLSNPTLLSKYLYETTIYNDPRCKECLLFPVCSGSCSWYRYQNLFEGKHFELCSYLKDKHTLEECLLSFCK